VCHMTPVGGHGAPKCPCTAKKRGRELISVLSAASTVICELAIASSDDVHSVAHVRKPWYRLERMIETSISRPRQDSPQI
jgi:hypothetical protein